MLQAELYIKDLKGDYELIEYETITAEDFVNQVIGAYGYNFDFVYSYDYDYLRHVNYVHILNLNNLDVFKIDDKVWSSTDFQAGIVDYMVYNNDEIDSCGIHPRLKAFVSTNLPKIVFEHAKNQVQTQQEIQQCV